MTAIALDDRALSELKSVRFAGRLIFAISGLTAGAWGAMVPFAKDQLGLTHGDLGAIILLGGMGAIMAMPIGSALIMLIGSRRLAALGGAIVALSLPGILLAPSGFMLGVVLLIVSTALGSLDIAVNAQAAIVEKRSGQPAMSSFHGFFSAGAFIAPLMAGGLIKLGLPPVGFLFGTTALILAILITQVRSLYPQEADSHTSGGHKFALPHGRTWGIGLICLVFYMAEGTMFDWTGLFLTENRGFDPAWAGLGLAVFSAVMTLVRLAGDRLVERFGPVRMVAYGAAVAAAGMLLAVSVPSAWFGILGFAIFGLGAGNVVPVAFSAAGRLPGVPPAVSIAAIATLGNCSVIAGPAPIGMIADVVGLPTALGLVAAIVVLVALSARVVRAEA